MKIPLRSSPLFLRFLPGEKITGAAILARLFWRAFHKAGARVLVGVS